MRRPANLAPPIARHLRFRISACTEGLGTVVAWSLALLLIARSPMAGFPVAWGQVVANTGASASPASLLSGTRQLTFDGRRSGEGYFSADGKQIVFQSEREPGNPFYQIYLMDLETGDVRRVSPGHGKTTCAWIHPSGDKVLFASTHEDPQAREKQKMELEERASGQERRYAWDYDETFEIYDVSVDGGEPRNLTAVRGYDAEGSWSPDGSLIAFASNRHAFTTQLSAADQEHFSVDPSYCIEVYVMRADGTQVRRLTHTNGYDGGPFFSPDGKRICWRRFSEDGATAEVFTMNIDGSDKRQLTRIGAMSWAPFYHPSGEYLIFTTNIHGFSNFELYLVDSAGAREPLRVTESAGFDGLPAFTPRGDQLYWTSNRTPGKKSQIFAASWNHEVAVDLLGASPAATRGTARDIRPPSQATTTRTEIDVADLRQHVEALASEAMDGRLTGTEGERLATEYVAKRFEAYGLFPGGSQGFFDEFSFTAGVAVSAGNRLVLHATKDATSRELEIDKDWRPLTFAKNGPVEAADIVFAGYGIVAPASEDFSEYDSYVHLDVKDRWVLMFRFLPENISQERRQHLARYSSIRHKAMVARDKGARGLLVVSGPNSKVREELIGLRFDASLGGTSVPAVSVSDSVASAILAASGKSLKALQDACDGGEPQMGFSADGAQLSARIALEKVRKTGRNVLALLAADDNLPRVVVGAHVDHLGRGDSGSLARGEERGEIHLGADDNASGVAAVLEIAQYLKGELDAGRLTLRSNILFAAWSGEELGLLGSRHYVDAAASSLGEPDSLRPRFAAYLNMDMVGRLDDALILQGVGSSSRWRREIEQRNAVVGLPLSLSEESYLPTDATSFYLKGVPILSAFTGSHGEYHTPRDTPDLLNYPGLQRVTRFIALMARGLATTAEPLDYVEQTREEKPGARAGLRAYLGTIPDYREGEIKGLRLSGVAGGGPAQEAGLRGGDVIVELAGRKIENIYDYTYAIDALKIGDAARVVVVRKGERLELEIVPASRE